MEDGADVRDEKFVQRYSRTQRTDQSSTRCLLTRFDVIVEDTPRGVRAIQHAANDDDILCHPQAI